MTIRSFRGKIGFFQEDLSSAPYLDAKVQRDDAFDEEMDHSLPWFTRFKTRGHYLICCYCRRYKANLHYLRYISQRPP
jgi:hypothetical protein